VPLQKGSHHVNVPNAGHDLQFIAGFNGLHVCREQLSLPNGERQHDAQSDAHDGTHFRISVNISGTPPKFFCKNDEFDGTS
jgi:hypothetical protein